MKGSIDKLLLQYGLILGALYQIYQTTFDVMIEAPINSIFINLIVTVFFVLLLSLTRLEKSINFVALLLHLALLPAFAYFWYYNGGIIGIVPFVLCPYIGFIIATTNGLIKWITIIIYLIVLVVLLYFPSLVGPTHNEPLNLDSKPIDYFIFGLVITLFTVYLKNKYLHFRHQVEIRNSQLERIATTLINQNEELKTQQEEIKAINENLENIIKEHTRGIEIKNRELAEYAFINAHMLRAPLSRILGLTSLIEMDFPAHSHHEIRNIKSLAHEMDVVVRKINEVLN
jgi:signal transduction histidine kinase